MQSIGGVLLRCLAVFAGAAAAYLPATAMPTWETGVLVACSVLIVAGALVDRWWAVAVLPAAALLYLAGAYVVDPSAFSEGHDAPGWYFATIFWVGGTVVSVVCLAAGVLLRRTVSDHGGGRAGSDRRRAPAPTA